MLTPKGIAFFLLIAALCFYGYGYQTKVSVNGNYEIKDANFAAYNKMISIQYAAIRDSITLQKYVVTEQIDTSEVTATDVKQCREIQQK